jgi:hypothetical protein
MAATRRRNPIESVMEELHGLLDAHGAFEDAVTTYFGLERDDLAWVSALAAADEGLPPGELAARAGVPADRVKRGLERLARGGHMEGDALAPAAHGIVAGTYERLEQAYVGLHRYGAEELGVVRTFLRVGRHYYEGQTKRFERATGACAPEDRTDGED